MIVTITKGFGRIYSANGILYPRYSKEMSSLTPELRPDVNGKLVTRHVRAGSKQPSPALSAAIKPSIQSDRDKALETQLRYIASDSSLRDDLELDFTVGELVDNFRFLTDLEKERFIMHLGDTEEISGAFLMALKDHKDDLLPDMMLIFNAEIHAYRGDDGDDGWGDYVTQPTDIINNVISDRNGLKKYMESKGREYTKLDDMSVEDRKMANTWLELRNELELSPFPAIKTTMLPPEAPGMHPVPVTEFVAPKFLDLLVEDRTFLQIAKERNTSDIEQLRLIAEHESAIREGVL